MIATLPKTDLLRVEAPQRQQIATILADAFQDDPMFSYLIPDKTLRQQVLPAIFEMNAAYALRYGEVYVTPALDGAAIWLPPEMIEMTPLRIMRAGMVSAIFKINLRVLGKLLPVTDVIERLHKVLAPMPHWYLSQIGVLTAHQGQGIGTHILEPMLARIDGEHLPCYLETLTPINVPFYQKHGFRVVAEIPSLKGGPQMWCMLRAAQ